MKPMMDEFSDEATNVMGGELLSSLTEQSRAIEIPPLPPIPEPEILLDVDVEIDVEAFPALGDEESTVTMEEPVPTTVAVRSRLASPDQ